MIKKLAAAIRPIDSVLRLGLRAPLRMASRAMGHSPAAANVAVAPLPRRLQM